MKRNRLLTRQPFVFHPVFRLVVAMALGAAAASAAHAADDRAAVSTINHAFATELGTGFYQIDGKLPNRIDSYSYSIMPGFEFDVLLEKDWILTPWLRAGASFAEGTSDGLLWGIGAPF